MNLLKYAIDMEKDGEQYYLKQAELYRGLPLSTVFQKLAGDERLHGELLKSGRFGAVNPDEALRETENVFSRLSDFKDDIMARPGQLEAYRAGLELERKSIELYEKMLKEQSDQPEDLIQFLIGQEKIHFSLLEELVRLLTHAGQWVEDAEFGLRKEEY